MTSPRIDRARRRELHIDQIRQLRHGGPTGLKHFGLPWRPDTFNWKGAREAWEVIGHELVAEAIELTPGRRPWGFWKFSSPEPRNPDEPEVEQLARLGLLADGERQRTENAQ